MEPKKYSRQAERLGWRLWQGVKQALDTPDEEPVGIAWNDPDDRELFCSIAEEVLNGLAERTERVQ